MIEICTRPVVEGESEYCEKLFNVGDVRKAYIVSVGGVVQLPVMVARIDVVTLEVVQ